MKSTPSPSTRTVSRTSRRYVRTTAGSQSLERGLALLRCFRLGTGTLTNAELAERSGLPRPTVSRLTRSLVDAGFLAYDHGQQAYRLGAVHLSLAASFRGAQRALGLALPLMRAAAERHRVNAGLAVRDQTEVIYLDSVRCSRAGMTRRVGPGSRIPLARSALGRACLASLHPADQQRAFAALAARHGDDWPGLAAEIRQAVESVHQHGYCWAQWQSRILSVATPIVHANGQHYALNLSLPVSGMPLEQLVERHGELLLALRQQVVERWQAAEA